MKIVHVTTDLSYRGGGVVTALRALVRAQLAAGLQAEVVGLQPPGLDALPEWGHVPVTAYRGHGPAILGYAPDMRAHLQRIDADLLHLHGLWTYPLMAAARWSSMTGRPLCVSAHGMLAPAALAHHRLRKVLAGRLYVRSALREAACLLALHDAEAQDFRTYGCRRPIAVIPNGVETDGGTDPAQPPPWLDQVCGGRHILLYLGRLTPAKGVAELVRAWTTLAPDRWTLVVAGPGRRSYVRHLMKAASCGSRASPTHVVFTGGLTGAAREAALQHASAFIYPSRGEAMPMGVLEAWARGLPVAMTEGCGLSFAFDAGAAWRLGRQGGRFIKDLSRFLSSGDDERMAMGHKGNRLAREHFDPDRSAERVAQLYTWCLDGRDIPAFVTET